MGKTLIKIDCIDQRLLVSSGPPIASGGRNEDEIEFNFCPLWDGFEKTAVFYRKKDDVYHAVIAGNRCVIPWEVLVDEGLMYFGVFGVKGNIARTSEIMRYRVSEGAITSGTKPSDPTPDIYSQYVNRITAIEAFTIKPEVYELTGNPVQLENFEGMPMNVVCRFDPVQSGSGEPSPSNIRPIAGRMGAVLTRCGKNLLGGFSGKTQAGITFTVNDDGSVHVSGTSTAQASVSVNVSLPKGRYVLSGCPVGGTSDDTSGGYALYTKIGSNYRWDTGSGVTFGLDMSAALDFSIVIRANTTIDKTFYPQIEFGSTASAFESYRGDTFTLNFGQTVYGGTLDVHKGEMMVDCGLFTLDGTELWSYSSVGFMYTTMSAPPMGAPQVLQIGVLSSHYRTDNVAITEYPHLRIYDTGYDSVDKWRAFLAAQYAAGTPVQIAYKLANPITISLTPQQITALTGVNTVYGDADEITVSGRKDILWLTSDLIKQIAELKNAIISLGGNV